MPTGLNLLKRFLLSKVWVLNEYLTAALKRVYVFDELPFDPELSYDEEKRLLGYEEFDYQNEHGIDLTQDQKLADWWADTAEDYE